MEDESMKFSQEQLAGFLAKAKACPFCGKKELDLRLIHFHHWVVCCEKCDAQGPVTATPQSAVEQWDKRIKVKSRGPVKNFTCHNCNEKKPVEEMNLDYEYDNECPPKLCNECWG